VGQETRQFSMMWAAQLALVKYGATHPFGILMGYGLSIGASLLVNEWRPVYEGVEKMWKGPLFEKIDLIGELNSEQHQEREGAFESLTEHLTRNMGRFDVPESLKELSSEYTPSSLNLKEIEKLLLNEQHHRERELVAEYLHYLEEKQERSRQETLILDQLSQVI
jgi:hypothetical protein